MSQESVCNEEERNTGDEACVFFLFEGSEFELEDFDKADVRPLLKLVKPQCWIYSANVSHLIIISRSLFQVWEVNTSMKMRDAEFEARRLLDSLEAAPPQFRWVIFDTFIQSSSSVVVMSLWCSEVFVNQTADIPRSSAQMYARSLTEQQQEAPNSKLLGPWEVVMGVVAKVLQGFWLPPPNKHLLQHALLAAL